MQFREGVVVVTSRREAADSGDGPVIERLALPEVHFAVHTSLSVMNGGLGQHRLSAAPSNGNHWAVRACVALILLSASGHLEFWAVSMRSSMRRMYRARHASLSDANWAFQSEQSHFHCSSTPLLSIKSRCHLVSADWSFKFYDNSRITVIPSSPGAWDPTAKTWRAWYIPSCT